MIVRKEVSGVRKLVRFMLFVTTTALMWADDGPVRKEIQAAYTRSIQGMRQAKTMDDLDALNKAMDTPDWVSIMPGQPPRTWAQLRSYGFENLNPPFDEMSFPIDTFTMKGEGAAIVQGTMRVTATVVDQRGQFGPKGEKHDIVSTAPIRDTWVKMSEGWRLPRPRETRSEQNDCGWQAVRAAGPAVSRKQASREEFVEQ